MASVKVEALKELFPSWEEQALLDVLGTVDGDVDAATSLVIEWSIGEVDSTLRSQPQEELRGVRETKSSTKASSAELPPVVARPAYDDVMSKRMVRHLTPSAIRGTMKMTSTLLGRARKAKAIVRQASAESSKKAPERSADGGDITSYLADRGLAHFHGALVSLGVESLEDLLNPDLVSPEDLCSAQVGMSPDDIDALYTSEGPPPPTTLGPSALGRLEHEASKHLSREDSISNGRALLSERLAFMGLATVQAEDDGNCQFRSLSSELFGSEVHYPRVRQLACDLMHRKAEEYAAYVGGDRAAFEEYISAMRQDRNWGDELTLRAVCDAFGVTIHVITTEKENWLLHYEPEQLQEHVGAPPRRLFLSYVSPIHYNTVAPVR